MRLRIGVVALIVGVLAGTGTGTALAHEPTVTEYSSGLSWHPGPWDITDGPSDSLWFTENNLSGSGSITAGGGVIDELSGLSLWGDVRGIAKGPDGNLWVTEANSPGKIARVSPTGSVTEWQAHPNPSFPVDITAGPDGNLWFVSQSPEFVGRITTTGTITHFTTGITPGSDLSSITTGPDGALWFTGKADPGRIGRITTDGVVTEFTAGLTANMAPSDIAEGPDGKLWFTENADPGGIGRISTSGQITEFHDGLTENARPLGIAAGSDGALWFTESASPGAIGRATTDGAITEHTAGMTSGLTQGGDRRAIPAGPDGALWFTESASPGAIGRATTDGAITEHTAGMTSGLPPWLITAGPDGNMWFTQNANPGGIGRITVPPGVKDHSAQHVDLTTASLRAKIRANAQDTYYYFEYGPTKELGSQTETAYAGNGWKAEHFEAAVSGLTQDTTYYVRPVATNDAGTTIGDIRSFHTKTPPVAEGDGSSTETEKKPEFAELVVAAAHEGTIRFKPPGARRWRTLTSDAELPVGATVDTRRGSVEITSAGRAGGLQTGRFGGGVFSLHQPPRARGRVDLRLRGGDFSRCKRPARRARGGTSAGASAITRVRRLWGRDSGGRYRTYGRHSHATVRGTRWLTEDRCLGTYTRVTQGSVVVRDTARRRSVVVRAGRSYFARRPRR